MLRYEVETAAGLRASDRAAWSASQATSGAAPSPCLTPEFFEAIARVRPTARVVIGRRGAEPVLFFPHHAPSGLARLAGLGRAIGGPIGDVQGVVTAPGIEARSADVLQAAGIALLPLRNVPIGDAVFGRANAAVATAHAFHVIDLADGHAAWEQSRLAYAKAPFRDMQRCRAKAEREIGPARLCFQDTAPAAYAAVRRWKAAQYVATGQTSVLDIDWVADFVDGLRAAADDAPLRCQISTLSFGDRLAAVHLGLRSPTTLHYWFPAYDPALSSYSPGNVLLGAIVAAAADEGVRQIHLGAGDYRYKQVFANCAWPMLSGVVMSSGLSGRIASAGKRLLRHAETMLPARLASLPGGIVRRLDRRLAFQSL